MKIVRVYPDDFLHTESHMIVAWFGRAFGEEEGIKTPFAKIKLRCANCRKIAKGGTVERVTDFKENKK